jgi:anti-sigma28 factor (negative regulator of flagellin synthesis)
MSNISNLTGSQTQSPIVRETGRIGAHATVSRRPGDEQRTPEIHVRPADSVDISALARRLGQGSTTQPVRQELVDRVKAEIAGGTYETADKLDLAADRLLRDLDVLG